MLTNVIDFLLHLDRHLDFLLGTYGAWTYAILFLVIFAETGLVATPFLPGDSLLFTVGAFAARGSLDLPVLLTVLTVAAITGDTVNYWIGRQLGRRAFSGRYRFFKQEYLQRTEEFYERYGSITIVLARFLPIVRTFAPFVAGIGRMRYPTFLLYNVVGGALWVVLFVVGGYLFGNLPFVRQNFSLFILGIILASLLPLAIEYRRRVRRSRNATVNTPD